MKLRHVPSGTDLEGPPPGVRVDASALFVEPVPRGRGEPRCGSRPLRPAAPAPGPSRPRAACQRPPGQRSAPLQQPATTVPCIRFQRRVLGWRGEPLAKHKQKKRKAANGASTFAGVRSAPNPLFARALLGGQRARVDRLCAQLLLQRDEAPLARDARDPAPLEPGGDAVRKLLTPLLQYRGARPLVRGNLEAARRRVVASRRG